MKTHINHLELESTRFGIKLARVDNFEEPIAHVLSEMRKQQIKLLISRAKSWEIAKINELENHQFRLMDTQITYGYELKRFNTESYIASDLFKVRDFQIADTDEIVELAGQSFDNYGHYAADKRLDKRKCLEIYKDWAKRSCLEQNVADKIIVAELDNQVIGYLSFKLGEKKGQRFAAGGMGAVSPKHRSLGVFSEIANQGSIWGKEIGLVWQEHNVIVANFPVNRSFIRAGFRTIDSFITFHCWLD